MTPPPRTDGWRLAALGAIATVTAVVSSLGAPLVPSIARAYGVGLGTAQWALTATLVAGAVTTPVIGRWASGRLRRPVLIGGLVVVLLGTVLSALPVGVAALVAGRALQGVGLALVPLALAVARDLWTGPRLASRLSWLSVATVAGAGLGYPVTAFVAEHLGIAGAYWFGAALVAFTLLLAVLFVPSSPDGEPQPVDLVGAALLSSGTVTVLIAISRGETWGWAAPLTVGLTGGGLLLVSAWVGWSALRVRRGRQPLVDLRLAARPGVVGPNVVAFGLGAGMYGLLTLAVILAQADGSDGFGLGHGVGVAGLLLVPYSLMSVGGSRVALVVARTFGRGALLPIGATVFASAMVLLAFGHDSLWQVLAAMALGGLGSGFSFSSMAFLIVPHVPPSETGSAMAFNQLLRYLGFSVGSAASVALIDVYGGGGAGFRGAALTFAMVCGAVGLLALGGRRRARDV
ncbi:MFS transporter [Mumia flava]|uniref:MFS transporter n=1 Tax=Mumia flava TaxID=1348852 RepID=A0A2M9BIU9_9ACTN|nr:MFS transporter [Mumia flava]PJJ57865.1 MFS transporter [Mumia flava]